jgi:alkylated DNA repair dioxygenase AlkB
MVDIPGLGYIADYLSQDDQSALIAVIDQQLWLTDLKRRVQHYGYRYDYKARRVDPDMYLGALPDWAAGVGQRLHADGYIAMPPDQLIVNEYVPGQGIANHVDCIPCFGDTILSLSLGSLCVMQFTEIASKREVPVLLEPGSLVVMQSTSRYDWQHGIAARKTDVYEGREIRRTRRLSLTFRKIINE